MNTLEALEALESAPQGNARLEALRKADSPVLRNILVQALSPQITFGLKKIPEPTATDNDFLDDSSWENALQGLLRRLASRELSGNDARDTVAGFLSVCTPEQRKWTERIIKQDLRLNIGAKEVNNTLGDGTVFQFAVPLAEDYAKVDGKHYRGRWAVEPKLDGARCVAYLPANRGKVVLYSRSGKEYRNFESVRARLQEINDLRNPAAEDLVLDGEVVSYVQNRIDFQSLQHTLFRKDGVESGQLRYLVFDATNRSDWERPQKTYEDRYRFAVTFISDSLRDVPGAIARLGVVDMFIAENPDSEKMLKYSRDFVERGYEGAMFRRADLPVAMKRSKSLLKVKSFTDDEAILTGAVEGTGKYEGLLGALQCQTKTGRAFEIGSGFTDEQRRHFWRGFKDLPKSVNFKYQELTEDGIPRFPVFRGFRHGDDQ